MSETISILVIEDDNSIRENITEILLYEEFQVDTAPNGEIGIEKAREIEPDLILCDVNMPGIDGHGVIQALREIPALAATPFIFLTALGDRKDVREGMELGADDYLTKPFKTADLLRAIETRLQQSDKREDAKKQEWDSFRKDLSSMIPHELKTPLNSLCTLSQVLRDDWKNLDEEDINEYLDIMIESGHRLERVAGNLSLYSHLRSARSPEELSEYAEEELFNVLISTNVEALAEAQGRTDDIQLELPENSPTCPNAMLFSKALSELLDNAFKFSNAGQKVVVTMENREKKTVITVNDHGPGLTPAQAKKVGALVQFDRKKKEQQGMGLGLSLAQEICNAMGGSLTIESGSETGTKVSMTFPV